MEDFVVSEGEELIPRPGCWIAVDESYSMREEEMARGGCAPVLFTGSWSLLQLPLGAEVGTMGSTICRIAGRCASCCSGRTK